MTLEEAINTRLAADAGVKALVRDRVYAGELPRDPEFPAIVFRRTAGAPEHSMTGASGLVRAVVLVHCTGKTYRAAREVADAVQDALDGFKGVIGTLDVDALFWVDEEYEYDDDLGLRWIAVPFEVWYIAA